MTPQNIYELSDNLKGETDLLSPSLARADRCGSLGEHQLQPDSAILSRFVLLALLAYAQTALTRFAGQACWLSVCSADPSGAKGPPERRRE